MVDLTKFPEHRGTLKLIFAERLSQFASTRLSKQKEPQSVNVVFMKAIIWIISSTYIFFHQVEITFFHFILFPAFSKSFSDVCFLAPCVLPYTLLYVKKRGWKRKIVQILGDWFQPVWWTIQALWWSLQKSQKSHFIYHLEQLTQNSWNKKTDLTLFRMGIFGATHG